MAAITCNGARPSCTASLPVFPCPTAACHAAHASGRRHSCIQRHAAASCRIGNRSRRWVAATAAEQSEVISSHTASALASLRYTSPDGAWTVRPMNKGDVQEVRRVVALQTDAFHTAAPLPMFDGMAKRFFEAEVLSEMQKKLKFNPDDLFVSLVIEPKASSSSSSSSSCSPGVVGVVEVSYIAHRETLQLLDPGTKGYCYIASMVVAPGWRRRGAAAALLAAAEQAAEAWDERQALLQVYQDNEPAIQLYRKAGYEVLHQQNKLWAVAGVRPRYLMRKRW